MGFDIHQPIFNRNGELDEKKADRYLNQIVKQYESTPEVRALIAEGEYGDSAGTFIEFGIRYLGLTPPEMTSDDLLEILFGLFPRKLSTPPEAAPYIMRELQALWIFLEREYGLTNAEECLKELEGKTVTRDLERELSMMVTWAVKWAPFLRTRRSVPSHFPVLRASSRMAEARPDFTSAG